MRRRIGIRELRDTLTSTIRRVRRGESIEITHDGEPVALLMPLPSSRIKQLIATGEVTPAKPLDRPVRRFPPSGRMTASQALQEDRAGR